MITDLPGGLPLPLAADLSSPGKICRRAAAVARQGLVVTPRIPTKPLICRAKLLGTELATTPCSGAAACRCRSPPVVAQSGVNSMGIFGALTTAVTGLRAQSFALENVSGNVANSQTTGFKRIDTSFVDLIPSDSLTQQRADNVNA